MKSSADPLGPVALQGAGGYEGEPSLGRQAPTQMAAADMRLQPLLLTPEAAARLVSIGRTKMYELLRVGAVESVRVGGSRRIPTDALVDYVNRLRAESSGYLMSDV